MPSPIGGYIMDKFEVLNYNDTFEDPRYIYEE